MAALSRQSGFTLVEVTLLLVMLGLLLGGAIKGYQIYRNSLLQSVFSTMKEYEQAAVQFKTTYRFWPGDFRYATTNLVGCTAASMNLSTFSSLDDDCTDGDGDETVGGSWPTGRYDRVLRKENLTFIRHLVLANLLEAGLLSSGGAIPTTRLGGIIYGRSLTDPGFAEQGVHLILAEQADDSFQPVLTPREASYIDAKFDDGRPGFGKLKFRGLSGVDNDSAVDNCTNGQTYRPTDNQKRCMMGLRIDQ